MFLLGTSDLLNLEFLAKDEPMSFIINGLTFIRLQGIIAGEDRVVQNGRNSTVGL